MRTSGDVTTHIEAPPSVVYDLVADVTRIGDFSPECRGAQWLGPVHTAAPGVQFRGRNVANRIWRWSRRCEVLTAEPDKEFSFRTIATWVKRDSTVWCYRLEAVGGGTDLTQSYDVVQLPPRIVLAAIRRLLPHHQDMRPHMQLTVEAIRRTAESATHPRPGGHPLVDRLSQSSKVVSPSRAPSPGTRLRSPRVAPK